MKRFHNTRVHRGDDIYCRVQLFVRQSRLPCVHKATFHSRIAVAGHGHRQTQKHLLPVSQAVYVVSVTVELAEIGTVHQASLPFSLTSLPFKLTFIFRLDYQSNRIRIANYTEKCAANDEEIAINPTTLL